MIVRLILIIQFFVVTVSFSQKRLADSLEKILPTLKDTSRIRVLIKLSTAYRQSDFDKSLMYAQTALTESEKAKSDYFIGHAGVTLGNVMMNKSKYDTAIIIYNNAIKYLEKSGNKKGNADAFNNISYANYFKANYVVALEYALKSLAIREQLKDTFGVIGSNTNIANIYYVQKEYKKALDYYQKNLTLAETISDDYLQGVALNNIGGVYAELKNIEKAIDYFKRAIEKRKKAGDKKGLAGSTVNIGVMYFELKKFNEAEQYLLEGLKLKQQLKDKYGTAHALLNLAQNSSSKNKNKDAISYLLTAGKIADSIGSEELKSDIYKALSDNYASENNFREAYNYRLLFNSVKDSVFNREKQSSINEMQTKFETEKKEKENLLLKQEAEINNLKMEEQQSKTFRLYAGLLLLVVMLAISIYAYRTKIQSNKMLATINGQIAKQNDTLKKLNTQLIESEDNLLNLNATKDKLFSIISHDISNPVNAIVNYNQLILNNSKKLSNDELISAIAKIDQSVQPLQELINNLLHWSILQRNNPNIVKSTINLADAVSQSIAVFNNYAQLKSVKITIDVSSNMHILFDANILQLVLRNLISNALKFTPAEGEVKIYEQNNFLIVEDNGAGMSEEKINAVLSSNQLHSSAGTNNEKGTGLGLTLVTEYLKLNGAKLAIKRNENNTGTQFMITNLLFSN
jgi:signal transduction histidine kinase